MGARHFLQLADYGVEELRGILVRAIELKQLQYRRRCPRPLEGRTLALLFEGQSTRTRISFEVGAYQLGASSLYMDINESQLGRGETPEDTARVLSRMVDGIVVRAKNHEMLVRLAAGSDVPIINALTDAGHPCQLLADLQTWHEQRGDIAGRVVAWIGDGNNVCRSWMQAAKIFDFELRVACPEGHEPQADADGRGEIMRDPREAAAGADLLLTDVWASMGQEHERQRRLKALSDYQLNRELLDLAAPDALYMHCLPAHRGEEISAELMDGDSAIWDAAENRLHAQKALLEMLLRD